MDVGDHPDARGADGVAAGLEPARGVDGEIRAELGDAAGGELPALARLGEAQVLVVHNLGDREAVVALGDVDLLGGVRHAGHLVGRLGRLARGAEGREVPGRVELGVPVPGGHRIGDAAEDRVGVGELGRQVSAREDRRGGAVGRRAAVEEPERLRHLGLLLVLLGGDLLLEVRLGVERAVVVVLQRHGPERLLRRAVLLHVAGGQEREHPRRGPSLGEHRVSPVHGLGHEAPPRRDLAHLLRSDRQDQVVLARGHRERRVPHRLDPGGAVGGHARDGDGKEIQRVGDEGAGIPLEAVEHRLVAAEPGRLELLRFDLGVGQGLRDRLEHHIGEALVKVLTELDDPGPDDRDFPAQSHAALPTLAASFARRVRREPPLHYRRSGRRRKPIVCRKEC